ncbi:hypothetical protein BJX61DRAFT_551250 [Aspergillus egyptiacus]|nr:hypothetical protein BJX61DRAFT_551250 [Aspergillus egyptiacus]
MGAYDEADDPRRVEIIGRIADSLNGRLVEPGFWTFLWLANIDKLEDYANTFTTQPEMCQIDICSVTGWTKTLKTCRSLPPESRTEGSSETPSTLTTPAPLSTLAASGVNRREPIKCTRSVAAADAAQCKKRDKNYHLITRGGDCVEAAHIYPFYLGIKVGTNSYTEGRETVANLICLASTVHGLWAKGKFALKPCELSADKTKLTVQFYWLPDSVYELKDLRTRPANPENVDGTTRQTRLFDCVTNHCICSGDILTFTTDNPEKWPLPSVHLLHMQWVLNRLVALAGAADVTDEDLDPDDSTGLAPPISVDDEMEVGQLEEAEEGVDSEEGGKEEQKGRVETAGASSAIPRFGENCPLTHAQGERQHDMPGSNPLEVRLATSMSTEE